MGNKESHPSETRSPHYEQLSRLFEDLAEASEKGNAVKYATFKSFFSCGEDELFCDQLFSQLLKHKQGNGGNVEPQLCKKEFINGLESVLQKGAVSPARNEFYFSIMSGDKDSVGFEDLLRMFNLAQCLTLAVTAAIRPGTEQDEEQSIAYILANTVTNGKTAKVDCTQFHDWAVKNCPRLMDGVHTWLVKMILHKGHSPASPIKCCPTVPRLFPTQEPDGGLLMTSGILWLLSTVLPQSFLALPKSKELSHTKGESSSVEDVDGKKKKSEWNLLYDSQEYGQSLNRFKHHCMAYRGPSVMLLELEAGFTLAVCVDSEWKESISSWGNADCRLLQIRPSFQVLKAGINMIYFNMRTRGLPSGIVLGQTCRPTVSLDTDLATARLFYLCQIKQDYCIIKVEVWGCGGLEAKEKQKQQQQWERRQAEKLQKVKLPGNWDENPDKSLLDMAGITTSHAQR